MVSPLLHGGDLYTASQIYGHPQTHWLDLSTGINVHSYPLPTIPANAWQQLPYINPQLIEAATHYYGCQQLLLSAGSQPVIELLPQTLTTLGHQGPVLLPAVGYQEHAAAWRQQGDIATYPGLGNDSQTITTALASGNVGHLVLINPNNPTGVSYSQQAIYSWAQQLQGQQGFVVIDEAFMDVTPQHSCVATDMPDNLVVLRSFGKFFGLAGIRLGAVIAHSHVLAHLSSLLGPWTVNGPAQAVAMAAFADSPWSATMRTRLLAEQAQQLHIWQPALAALGAHLQADTPLFRSFSISTDLAQELHTKAAQAGILIRPIQVEDNTSLLRFGNLDLTRDNLTQQARLAQCQKWLASIG